jgi:hypothetical protein
MTVDLSPSMAPRGREVCPNCRLSEHLLMAQRALRFLYFSL